MAKIVTGLDIGTDSIKLVQVKRTRGDSFKIIASASLDIPSSETNTPSAVSDTIRNLIAQSKIHPVNLITAIPKQFVVVRHITLPTTDMQEVAQMIRFEATKYVPFLAEEDIVDFELIGSTTLGGSDILLTVSKRSAVEDHLALLRGLHIEPYAADVNSLALTRAFRQTNLFSKESDKTYLVMDLGANLIELSLVQNGGLRYTRTATIAGTQLIKSLQENLNISYGETHTVLPKLDLSQPDFGIPKYPKEQIEKAVNSWLDRLDNEIKRSIDYFSSEFGVTQIQTILISGGLARISHLKEHLEKEIGIPTIIANPVSAQLGTSSTVISPHLNTAFGLALRKLDAPLGAAVNLLPPEILQKRIRRKRQAFVAQVSVGILVLAVGAGVFGYQRYVSMETQMRDIDRELLGKKAKTENLAEKQKQIDSIKKIMTQADAGVDTLANISQMDFIPASVTLERFTYERNKAVTIYAVSMTMDDAVNFRFAVERTGLFEWVKIQNANPDLMEGKSVIRFQVICKLKPGKETDFTGESSSQSTEES